MPAGIDPLDIYSLGAVAVLALALLLAALRLRALSREVAALRGETGVLDRMAAAERETASAARQTERLSGRVDRLAETTQRSLQRVALVRYDAFREMGGHLSFSLALLDARQDGVVISVLNDREGARAYAKPISGGRSTFTLSEEELRAVGEA